MVLLLERKFSIWTTFKRKVFQSLKAHFGTSFSTGYLEELFEGLQTPFYMGVEKKVSYG